MTKKRYTKRGALLFFAFYLVAGRIEPFATRMSPLFLQLVLFGLLAAAANVLGGLVLFPSKLHHNFKHLLKYLLALGAGFMLAVTIFEILPKSLTLWQHSTPADSEDLYIPMMLVVICTLPFISPPLAKRKKPSRREHVLWN